ncbi:MAG TPA: hypothetical protein VF162_19055 [Streptosporangiaceae bacterium]
MAGVAALAVILVAAGAVAVVLSARGETHAPAGAQPATRQSQSAGPSGRPSAPAAITTADIAAIWVDRQVNHDVIVACDQAMCEALTAHGFPGRHLKLIRPGAPYPVRAQVVVETPAVRRQFGARRNVDLAPPVLVRFGHGSAAISVRVVAPRGAVAYRTQLKAAERQRRREGAGLLASSQVRASPAAMKELLAGRVDARLIVVLTTIASVHPIDILRFGTLFTGMSPRVPMRTAVLALNDPAARLSKDDYLRVLLKQIDAQPDVYRPLIAAPVRDAAGIGVFQITFSAPSPLRPHG